MPSPHCFPPTTLPIRKGKFYSHSCICGLPEEAGIRLSSSTASSCCPRESVMPQLLCQSTQSIQVFPALHWFCSCSLPLLFEDITYLVLPAFPSWWLIGAPLWSLRWTYISAFILRSSSRNTRVDIKSCWASQLLFWQLCHLVTISRDGLNNRSSHTWLVLADTRWGASSKWLCWKLCWLVISTGVWTSTVLKAVTALAGGTEAGRWYLTTSCD